jgi:hypothetical protein
VGRRGAPVGSRSSSVLGVRAGGGRRGSGGGGEVGVSDKGKQWGRKYCGKQASRCAGECHLEPSPGPSTCISSQAMKAC